MTRYRNALPQLDGGIFLMDGGLETTLVFHDKIDLPYFASFDLLREREGKARLRDYYQRYLEIARERGFGFILEAPTWRANADWGAKMGYSALALAAVNREAVEMLEELRAESAVAGMPVVVSGCLGPRGDGYDPGRLMSVSEAEDYHAAQIETFAGTGADMISAMTITNVSEAVGIARAAKALGMPASISFTVETDGRLPTGQTLGEAIGAVDSETGNAPAYFMINCAHPTHFSGSLPANADWMRRVKGLRANASRRSHAELDESTYLDDGDPQELAGQYAQIIAAHGEINVVGGCCGTDHRHISEIGNRFRQAA
jgi:S-methylmethionine-dependent homocysteine/selenocysteine methylase